ncbi:glutathione S-transferase Ure2-like protein [Akanthomyces lecanii RCEF 1005]|uniref:Glutathione S-transferase Ure2-like protein n=1 Tax=Akanthomyces lecanii RCEF 1005 TaxID=1081108 RepID=A0A168G0A0_CORDF|nr:glutathione S-transferase Ure2-like protein [Akanthomyces lecanii RCEF 1005]
MSATLKPIKVWGKGGPNPPKVAIVLEELGLPAEFVVVPFSDVKKPEYLAINPNGRLPAIHDPNTGLTMWESGAIVEYLTEKYDTEHKISFPTGSPEAYETKQYLYFQASGQGPYYGQAAWFKKFHHEKLPSAVERYVKEMHRVTAVLDKILSEKKVAQGQDGPWLVGGRCSIADLSFASWTHVVPFIFDKTDYNLNDYPFVKNWHERMLARPGTAAGLGSTKKLA